MIVLSVLKLKLKLMQLNEARVVSIVDVVVVAVARVLSSQEYA